MHYSKTKIFNAKFQKVENKSEGIDKLILL